jgi:hypothetical protein
MRAGLKKNGTRAFVAVIAVCAALSPAALAAVGGVSAAERERAAGTGGVVSLVPAARSGWAPGKELAGRPDRQ